MSGVRFGGGPVKHVHTCLLVVLETKSTFLCESGQPGFIHLTVCLHSWPSGILTLYDKQICYIWRWFEIAKLLAHSVNKDLYVENDILNFLIKGSLT